MVPDLIFCVNGHRRNNSSLREGKRKNKRGSSSERQRFCRLRTFLAACSDTPQASVEPVEPLFAQDSTDSCRQKIGNSIKHIIIAYRK